VCARKWWTMAKQPVAVASRGEAPIDGGDLRVLAAPIAKLRLLRRQSSGWRGRVEAGMGGEAGGVLGLVRGVLYL
jgi:hypothetical protein